MIFMQFLLIPALVAFALVPWCCKRISNWFRDKVDGIFFNSIITFIDSTFLVIFLIGLLHVREVKLGHLEVDNSFWFALSALIVCTLELLLISIFLKCFKGRLDEDWAKRRCGSIYEDLNYRIRGGWALTYPIFYQLRFLALALIVIFMSEYLVFQVLTVILSTVMIVAVLGMAHPFSDVKRNYKMIGSEYVVIVIMDMLLFTSDPSNEPSSRSYIGGAMIAALGISLFVS